VFELILRYYFAGEPDITMIFLPKFTPQFSQRHLTNLIINNLWC